MQHGEGIWDWDIPKGVVTHNRRWCQIVGLDDAYLQHPLEDFSSLLYPDDRPGVIEKLHSCLAGGGRYQSEHRMQPEAMVNSSGSKTGEMSLNVMHKAILSVWWAVLLISVNARLPNLKPNGQASCCGSRSTALHRGSRSTMRTIGCYLCNESYKRIYETSRDLIVKAILLKKSSVGGALRGAVRCCQW
jgi:hypothetical protein